MGTIKTAKLHIVLKTKSRLVCLLKAGSEMNSSMFDIFLHIYELICSSGHRTRINALQKRAENIYRKRVTLGNVNVTMIRKIKKSFVKSIMLAY